MKIATGVNELFGQIKSSGVLAVLKRLLLFHAVALSFTEMLSKKKTYIKKTYLS